MNSSSEPWFDQATLSIGPMHNSKKELGELTTWGPSQPWPQDRNWDQPDPSQLHKPWLQRDVALLDAQKKGHLSWEQPVHQRANPSIQSISPKTNLEQQLINAEPEVRGDKTKTFPSNPTKLVRQRWKAVNRWIIMISRRRSITFKWIHSCRLASKEAWIDSDSQQNNRWFVHSNTAKTCLSLHQ